MNKKVWSLLTIMMVAVMSFGFASCSSDDDEEQVGSYCLDFNVTDRGNLTNAEANLLEDAIDDVIGDEDEFENVTLSSVVNNVKSKIKSSASSISEAFPGKSFTVLFIIKDMKDLKAVEKIELKCVDGQIK
ncbi:hypothetical protein [Prevotella sp. E2-28]|uniref:hypothetical protein n=1 Tax=Prevotella sp. E2-28 TaxID=2913620 RepID=UPI001EDBEC07|nr:hypothetical protein [Prevotella sp. E2-28]UKK53765.1 hypothetical protein L6465_00390 [Prevotella sp. E2-28]